MQKLRNNRISSDVTAKCRPLDETANKKGCEKYEEREKKKKEDTIFLFIFIYF